MEEPKKYFKKKKKNNNPNVNVIEKPIIKNIDENTKMFLFGRWMSVQYADEHLDENRNLCSSDNENCLSALNREDGYWWKKQLEYFNDTALKNYVKNGTYKSTFEFLSKNEI